jgi:hypothetical protein
MNKARWLRSYARYRVAEAVGPPIARTVLLARGLRFRAAGYNCASLRPRRLQRGILDQLSTPMPQLQSENHEANGHHRCM